MKKEIFPCILTLANLSSGVLTIIFAVQEKLPIAILFFVLAMFFDTIDGRLARYLNATSDFGKELDSLADLVSFGIAPAIILYLSIDYHKSTAGILEYIVPVVFAVCGALRLARYNILNIKDHFVGMPIPVAAGLLLISIAAFKHISYWYIVFSAFLLSYLMVSKVKLPRI